MNKDEVEHICNLKHPLSDDSLEEKMAEMSLDGPKILSKEEKEVVLRLRNREFIVDSSSPNLKHQLIDILYSFLYDY